MPNNQYPKTLTLSQFSQAYVDRRNSRLKHYAWISAKTDHKYFDFQALVCRLDADNAAELPEDCTLVLVVATNDQGKRITIGLPVYTYNQLLKSSNLPSIENFDYSAMPS